jgi:hypothetical protein
MRWLIYTIVFHGLVFAAEPQWIWSDKPAKNQTTYFRRLFSLPEQPKRGFLRGAAVDSMKIHVNDQLLGVGDNPNKLFVFPVSTLRKGGNVIAIECTNKDGRPGLGLVLEILMPDDQVLAVSSNDSFTCHSNKPSTPWKTLGYTSNNWSPAKVRKGAGVASTVGLDQLAGKLDSIELGVTLGDQFHLKLLGASDTLGRFTLVQGLELSLFKTKYVLDEVTTMDGVRVFWLKSKRSNRRYGPFRYEHGGEVFVGGLRFMLQP